MLAYAKMSTGGPVALDVRFDAYMHMLRGLYRTSWLIKDGAGVACRHLLWGGIAEACLYQIQVIHYED